MSNVNAKHQSATKVQPPAEIQVQITKFIIYFHHVFYAIFILTASSYFRSNTVEYSRSCISVSAAMSLHRPSCSTWPPAAAHAAPAPGWPSPAASDNSYLNFLNYLKPLPHNELSMELERGKSSRKDHHHLQQHQDAHTLHPCSHCAYKAKQKSDLQRHIESVHEAQIFPCTHCKYKATRKDHLQKHVKTVHQGQAFQCNQCKYKAKQRSDLQRHIRSVHEGQTYSCTHCTYKATRKDHLQKHIKSVHEGVAFQYKFKPKQKLFIQRHTKSVHEAPTFPYFENGEKINKAQKQTFPCSQCDYKAKQKSDLQRHVNSVHEGQTFPCPHCEYKSSWETTLRTHIKSVHEGKKFQCPHCKYKATRKDHLRTHIKSVHESQTSMHRL